MKAAELVTTRESAPSPERALFATVLRIAIEDYKAGKLSWFYFATKDFRLMCRLAGVNPERVHAGVRAFVAPLKAKAKRIARTAAKAKAKRARRAAHARPENWHLRIVGAA